MRSSKHSGFRSGSSLTPCRAHDRPVADQRLEHVGRNALAWPIKPMTRIVSAHLCATEALWPMSSRVQPVLEIPLQYGARPRAQPDRARLFQTEALPPRRHSLPQAWRGRPGNDPIRLNAVADVRLRLGTAGRHPCHGSPRTTEKLSQNLGCAIGTRGAASPSADPGTALETLFDNPKVPLMIREEALAADMGATTWG
ncbi:Hypothetical protein NGAL_HAMBI1145_11910 [Neorhizobium galegae bv. officinalis]|uniref:Uncharacterized protein n=1 Tax=Neorhizobium galegae bv. officinalis TaxID=323656 RepID=A0A0T7FBL7_NEOGA|nr:Hypothetical protein NGAL_HAMBI1145_11910 [Neorhizobium galegae bv. officinalis]